MDCAGILLTGGASRRMGCDKARLTTEPGGSETLAARTARILATGTTRAVEVGPGRSGLPSTLEDPRGGGPLVAVAAGWEWLGARGWDGPVVVVATDLPRLTAALLGWLVERPGTRSVVPVAAGRVQPLCARYSAGDMRIAADLVRSGTRSMRALLDVAEADYPTEDEWTGPAGDRWALVDVDTPADVAGLRGAARRRDPASGGGRT